MASKLVNLIDLTGLSEFLSKIQAWVRDRINETVALIYDVELDSDGEIDTVDANLTYSAVANALNDGHRLVLLRVIWGDTLVYATANQEFDSVNGPILFWGELLGVDGQIKLLDFHLSTSNDLTISWIFPEHWYYKVQSVVDNSTDKFTYPSTKAVFDEYQRKPVVVWRAATDADMLKGIQANLSASPEWQLTGLDLTPYHRIKVHSKCGQGSGTTSSSGTTAAMVLEIMLDPGAAIAAYNGNYCASIIGQKPNNDNRLVTLTCAVSADKTSFVVLRQTNLYGTAATNNDDVNADVFLIEGYYD